MCVSRVFLFFFFFQAEDGIRDHCVTGVQTCALPISLPRVARGKVFSLTARRATRTLVLSVSSRETTVATLPVCWAAKEAAREKGVRSEERRVGKECRGRWSPDDGKKKRRKHKEMEEK